RGSYQSVSSEMSNQSLEWVGSVVRQMEATTALVEKAARRHKARGTGRTKAPEDAERWTHVFRDMADAVGDYAAAASDAVNSGAADLLAGFEEQRLAVEREE